MRFQVENSAVHAFRQKAHAPRDFLIGFDFAAEVAAEATMGPICMGGGARGVLKKEAAV